MTDPFGMFLSAFYPLLFFVLPAVVVLHPGIRPGVHGLAALLLTGFLLAGHLPFYPFHDPGAIADEMVILFAWAMAVRWAVLARVVVTVARRWAERLRSRRKRLLVPPGLFVLHLALGLVNALCWFLWLETAAIRSPRPGPLEMVPILVAVYFLLPVLELSALVLVAMSMPPLATPPEAA